MIVMDWLTTAFERTWFYVATIIIGVIYGFGGLVHIGNILGFGEMAWAEAPLSWKLGDIFWGILDIIAVVGIILKAPVGVIALALAALSQIVVYGIWPERFALTDEHFSVLRGMVYFHVLVLIILGFLAWFASSRTGT